MYKKLNFACPEEKPQSNVRILLWHTWEYTMKSKDLSWERPGYSVVKPPVI